MRVGQLWLILAYQMLSMVHHGANQTFFELLAETLVFPSLLVDIGE